RMAIHAVGFGVPGRSEGAAGTFTENGVRGTVNVESIAGTLMVQHYHAVSAEPTRVEMLSKRSRGYVMHLIPVHFLVRWTMTAASRTGDTKIGRARLNSSH